jgi:GH24 family phage-related lysozyme (muramidase)
MLALLADDVFHVEHALNTLKAWPWKNDNLFDALVSLGFNVGTTALTTSNILKLIKTEDLAHMSTFWTRWSMAGGRRSAGLLRRRSEELEWAKKGEQKP